MFCESRTINNVIAYVNEYYINSKGLFNAQSNECLLEISGQQELYPFGKDHLISREIVYGDSAIININDLTIVINNYRIEAQNYPYFSFYEVDDKPQEGIYDFEKKKILFEATSWLGRSIIDKYIFRNFKKKIACRKIDSDSILWEFPLSSLGKGKDYSTDEEFDYEVEQFVGIYNNILWVYIERGGFIGLDIQTGELKHRILGIPKGNLLGKVDSYVDSEEFYIFYRAKFILDEKKGIIIGLIADRFFEIDLNKEKITPMLYGMWDKMEKMNLKKYGVNGNTSLQEDLLYFYNDKELQFGILDINTKEIIYISEPIAVVERDDSFTRLRDLKVSENKVYILDSNHTLHIFEREE
ncbi:hypothetical protein JMN12_03195 [Capnocytophaga genosp. AHN8471]|uniref:hypothetical protein n=1 Tax=Capnocytophaga genosp. AHN8471 TaxID=327574 RepID=UPI001931365A|nr:hypothetical protein [Capnocytophaga genosp. AHN8471]MBM0655577.1 hypothetical protein [Capnocytophaga genosp. AHN8471]